MNNIFEILLHNVPFMALMTTPRPANRPLATRLSEQTIVSLVTAVITANLTLWISSDRQEGKINALLASLQEIKLEMVTNRVVLQDVAMNKFRLDIIEHKHAEEDKHKQ